MDEITKLIEGQNPGEFDLSKEIATTDALRAYVAHLLRAGEAAVETFVRMQGTTRELNQLLQAAPASFRESASCARRFADTTSWEDIKQNYQTTADLYEAKAKTAEMHQNDVAANLNSDLLSYLKDQNVFMERLLTMLNQGLVSNDLREFARFKNMLQEIIIKHDFLRETLRTWRARMQGEPTAPKPEPEPQRSEAGPAAPPPQVKRVAWSSSAPAAPPTTTDSAYWEQVRELEAAWEDEMSGLLIIVRQEQPQELRDPMMAVIACRGQSSWYMERLLRRGIAIEAAMVRVERTAHRLDDLLKQPPSSHRLHIDLTERTSCGQSPQFGGTTGRRPMPLRSFSGSFRTRSNPLPASWRSSGLATAASASITTTQPSRTPTPLALAVRISRRRFNAPSSCISLFGSSSATRGCRC